MILLLLPVNASTMAASRHPRPPPLSYSYVPLSLAAYPADCLRLRRARLTNTALLHARLRLPLTAYPLNYLRLRRVRSTVTTLRRAVVSRRSASPSAPGRRGETPRPVYP